MDAYLIHHLISASAARTPGAPALSSGNLTLSYASLWRAINGFAQALIDSGLERNDRIGIYLDKRPEAVVAAFGATNAGCVFVPINPVLKAAQVKHILKDCNVRLLVSSSQRLAALGTDLADCPDLSLITLIDDGQDLDKWGDLPVLSWPTISDSKAPVCQATELDMAAIFYTSGSTGQPKGVVLSHRNLVAGATSVAGYLANTSEDVILAALPLSFDAGFSQLTTAFSVGAHVVLLNYLMPRDIVKAVADWKVTGLTCVPPLWIQLAQQRWQKEDFLQLRYIASTGGRMPLETLKSLRTKMPEVSVYLMYGLTEAFRATYLPPEQVDLRPDSIGKAIPNNEVLVLRNDGTPCEPDEPGELVQRGPLVAMGYWNDPGRTAERFKPLPARLPQAIRPAGLPSQELAVFSGDTVKMDNEGYLYFIGRSDEMIKTSGYRISPTEVEESAYTTGLVLECCAFGFQHDSLGEAIALVISEYNENGSEEALRTRLKTDCPSYMIPSVFICLKTPLPRNANGKIDRNLLKSTVKPSLSKGDA